MRKILVNVLVNGEPRVMSWPVVSYEKFLEKANLMKLIIGQQKAVRRFKQTKAKIKASLTYRRSR